MKIDLLHNKIIKDTATESFISSFESCLIPKLIEKYAGSLQAVEMYEDHLTDGFVSDGVFYYPLSLVVDGKVITEWIEWCVREPRDFADGVPFSYIGEGELDISLSESVPEEFVAKIGDDPGYFEGGTVTFKIQSVSEDKTFLAGKYSQSFIDEMARQLSRKIEDAFSVSGIEDSGIELLMVFAPGTYMEHVVENVTYRRLLITARGCSARDLWIKWIPEKSGMPLTVSDKVTADDVTFELGEDVSQKIREKEYRFLVRTSADKYQAAMGRKNVTEWRDLIKRVIKRGELTKIEPKLAEPEGARELSYKLQELLMGTTAAPVNTEPEAPKEDIGENDNSDLTALLKGVLGETDGEGDEEPEEENAGIAELFDAIAAEETESISEPCEITEPEEEEAEEAAASEASEEAEEEPEEAEEIPEEAKAEEASALDEREALLRENERLAEIAKKAEADKLELEARIKAEAEALYLRRAHEELRRENERLAEIAKKAEADKLALLAEREAEIERYKQELEARERREAIEKERIAEAARLALLEEKRKREEALENEKRAALMEEERRNEEARLREEKLREEERVRIEAEARAEALARATEENERLRREKDEAIARAAAAAKTVAEEKDEPAVNYTYTSKNARLLFRRPVDPNVTKRIHEIILTTIKYFHKENVYIKIKATVPDSTTVNLHFVKIPEEETELLIQIIKVLGKSDLGITKVFLE